ncbi:MAG TPA: sugar ABC transporter ATP-binding protein [Vicinamibacteria bacterium]|nr:sugar ABC transporter ATP-binding protein [Vicinamibacteria bacterium]
MAELKRIPRLSTHGLRKRFGATVAVDGVDFAVSEKEVRALVGENGAGKTTLMNLLSGVERPDAGTMQLDGRPYEPSSPGEARSTGVAMIHQELALAPHLTVMENLFLGVEPSASFGFLRFGEMRSRAIEALRTLGHPNIDLDRRVASLPISMRQIVEIARALVLDARVLILDEPTSCLSRPDIERLFRLIGQLKERGLAVVYISHFLEEVVEIADSFTVLRDGRSVAEGGIAQTNLREMVRAMVGREVEHLYPRSARIPGDVVLQVKELAGELLPRSASFELRRGEVLGIAGLMGAGRTELMRALFGLDGVRHGSVCLGVDCGPATPRERWRQGVGISSEDRQGEGLAMRRSIAENMTLSRLQGLGPSGLVMPARVRQAAQRWVNELSIQCRETTQEVAELSGGNQQKVALARLLHHDLDVLLLDEPTRGIDVAAKQTIYSLIDELASRGKAILLVSSYLPELLGMADRIGVMRRGVLSEVRPTSDWDELSIMAACTDMST